FLITVEVPEIYMYQFWNTNKKIKDTDAYQFKMDKQKFRIDTKVFREILQICPRLPNQDFVEPPSDEEMVPFIKDLVYTGKCDMLSKIHTDQMHQPWRTFVAVINRYISRKSTGLNRLTPSRAQILWGMFYKKNVDFVALLWEDLCFKQTTEIKVPHIINQAIQDSKEYKIYLAFSTREATLKKAKKFKKIDSPLKKHTLFLEKEPAQKPKRAKHPEPAKKSAPAKKDVSSNKPSRKQSTGVQIRDTPDVSVSKKKAPTTTDRSKGIDLLFEAALLEDAQIKKVLKRSKRETHSHQASGSGVPDVPKDQSESENESWGESGDDDSNDDDSDDDNDDGSDNDGVDNDKKEYEDEYVRTPSSYESIDDENEHVGEEEYDRIDEELYKDVNMKLKDVEHGEEGKRDAEMTYVGHDDVTQETTYDQVEDDAHVTLTTAHVLQKTEVPLQTENEIISMINVDVRHEEPSSQTPSLLTIPVTVIPESLIAAATTIPPPIPPFIPLLHQSTPTPTPTTTTIPVLPDFSSLFKFNQRVSNMEKGFYSKKDSPVNYTAEFENEAQAEEEREIHRFIEKSIEDIINDEVKTQLPQILPKAVSDFATPVIKSTVIESLKDVVLAKSSSQPQSTYKAAASLTEFELKKIIIDKMEKT
ncbi:hypothetical protein Tco_0633636, partial [Tanacetum coccineum]